METINELTKALSKMQGELTSVPKESINPFFKSKYASLDAIWDTIRKPLSLNGLSIIQLTGSDGNGIFIKTMLCHSTGQFVESYLPINAKASDPQSVGSAITYARRYALSAILGVSADDDDDAEAATHKATPKKADKPPEHWCATHNVEFFKKGAMKSYAHKIEGTETWCNEPEPAPKPVQSTTAQPKPTEPVSTPSTETPVPMNAMTHEAIKLLATDPDKLGIMKATAKDKGWTKGKTDFTLKDLSQVQAVTLLNMFSE